jgi:hypothetical protein
MNKIFSFFMLLLTSALLFSSCCVCQKSSKNTATMSKLPAPQVIIYQTRADYSQLVPIILSADKKSVVSYPDIRDIYTNGSLAYPTQLKSGYFLDNRGINPDVAFIKLKYEEYAALPKTPLADELLKMVVDADPIKKMYACGLRNSYSNLTEELNARIEAGDFKGFTTLK